MKNKGIKMIKIDMIQKTDAYDLREQLADLCHQQWSGWMKYLFSKSKANDEDGTLTIPASLVNRWHRQLTTNYADLPGDERDSDRKEADKFLCLLQLALLDGQDRDRMLIKTVHLKQTDGEGWVAGRFLQEVLQVDRHETAALPVVSREEIQSYLDSIEARE